MTPVALARTGQDRVPRPEEMPMAHVPTDAEIDAMSDEELEAYLAQAGSASEEERADTEAAALPAWRRPGGAPRTYGWILVVCAALGVLASWQLMLAELAHLRDPMATLSCDVSPLVSCGASLDAWQAHLLGVPNSFVGAMAFAVLLLIGALLATGHVLPRWTWWGLAAGSLGGVVFVAWFLGISVTVFGKLCPYCMVIWAVTIPVAAHTWARAAVGGHLGLSRADAARILAARWWLVGAMYLAVVLVVAVGLRDAWAAVL